MLLLSLKAPFLFALCWILVVCFIGLINVAINRDCHGMLYIILSFGVPIFIILVAVIYHVIRFYPFL